MADENKRIYERVRLDRPTHIQITEDKKEVQARIVDLSVGGAGICCDQNVPQGTTIDCRFQITYKEQIRELKLRGQVKYTRILSEGFHLGIQFQGLSDKAKAFLAEVISSIKKQRMETGAGWAETVPNLSDP